jgi:hypothetical protein
MMGLMTLGLRKIEKMEIALIFFKPRRRSRFLGEVPIIVVRTCLRSLLLNLK